MLNKLRNNASNLKTQGRDMSKKNIWTICGIVAIITAVIVILLVINNGKHSNTKPANAEGQEASVVDPEQSELDGIIIDDNGVYESNVESAKLDNKGHIILTLIDGSKLDQGYVGGKIDDGNHLVVFLNLDNSILKVQIVKDGGSAEPPENLGIEGYEFCGWKGDYNNITKDTIVYATYIKQGLYHTVTFCDEEGNIISSERVHTGANAVGPEVVPKRDGFVFSGWDKSVMNVNRDITVLPVFVEADSPLFVVDSVIGNPGKNELKVQIRLVNNPGICSAKLNVSYGYGLSLKSYAFSEELGGTSVGPETTPQTGQSVFLWYSYDADYYDDSVFVTLIFDVTDDAQGMQEIKLDYDSEDVFNQAGEDIHFDLANGAVRIPD